MYIYINGIIEIAKTPISKNLILNIKCKDKNSR
jgi:hypothetical protein